MLKKFLQIFLGTQSVEEMRQKGVVLTLAVPALRWADWVAMGIVASIVAVMKKAGWSNLEVFVALWGLNLLYSGGIVILGDALNSDITLMQGLRRLVSAVFEKSFKAGLILEIIILFRLLVWDGPDQFIIFFRDRLNGRNAKIGVFVVASAIQMGIWTFVYVAGYEFLF